MINIENLQDLSDEEVVKLSLANQDFFGVLINRYKLKLFNFIRTLSNLREEDAEDLLQEIFLKVYLNLNDFDGSYKFSTWIYAIARNKVIDNHRRLKARAEGYATDLEDDGVKKLTADIDIEKDIDLGILKKKVQSVLDNMDEKYREVLVLKYLEEKNYNEISDIIQKRMGTVSSTLNRAKEIFRQELKKQDIKF